MGRVSVIVPVYNGETYIGRCIDSIINQTYRDLEIIIVDDGSHDDTYEICKGYEQQDDRITVYRRENEGVSAARNYGLQKATGTYVQFVDADDYLKKSTTKLLCRKMEKENAGMVVCSYMRLIGRFAIPSDFLELPGNYTAKEYLIHTLKDPGHHYYGVVWNKLYRNDVIKKQKIQFRRDVTLGEDFIFNLEYMQCVKKISVILGNLYYYNNVNGNSLSRQNQKDIDICRDELYNREKIYDYYVEIFQKNLLYEVYRPKMEDYWLKFYVRQLHYLKGLADGWATEEKEVWLKEVTEHVYISQALKNSTEKHLQFMKQKFNWSTDIKMWIKALIK